MTKSVAVVSGKGGSGKTLVSTAMAIGLAIDGAKVALVDADFGTGGLTYYLGFTAFEKSRTGLAEYIYSAPGGKLPISHAKGELVFTHEWVKNIDLVPVGHHRLFDDLAVSVEDSRIAAAIRKLKENYEFVIIDCRGGIDAHSLSVCKNSDEIIIVVETDAASIQASQFLTSVLDAEKLRNKIVGFMLNKVMDDPTALANTGRSLFRADFLGAIPFDIATTRNFIRGNIPDPHDVFTRHVLKAASSVFPENNTMPRQNTLTAEQFSTITSRDPAARNGRIFIFVIQIYLISLVTFFVYEYWTPNVEIVKFYPIYIILSIAVSAATISEITQVAMGRAINFYSSMISRLFERILR